MHSLKGGRKKDLPCHDGGGGGAQNVSDPQNPHFVNPSLILEEIDDILVCCAALHDPPSAFPFLKNPTFPSCLGGMAPMQLLILIQANFGEN